MGILRQHLQNECDPRLPGELAYSVKEAYSYLRLLVDSNPILQNKEMKKTYGHLRQGLVDVALRTVLEKSGLNVNVHMRSALHNRNGGYTYSMIEAKGAIISPAKTRSVTALPRKALHRDIASVKNRQFDLFTSQEEINQKYDENTPPFLLLTYGGKNNMLGYVQLGLPDIKAEMWIEQVDIINAPRIIVNNEENNYDLGLTLTKFANDIMKGESYGEEDKS
ncbi:hypothetical protein [Ligilactobacillus salivarius]|uniref:hypothetical protein n=1 Tax=Ligilactobacillus salivarius TaxID=1624 RepID=UPI00136E7618|nr:hypothetical protein [Ligilactobacillus salivarius]MYY23196.1 hypothetical protein [Ligilactobacillus salivarius]MYY40093.1 hypothetical protein [Ligilactobacillus salivarius]